MAGLSVAKATTCCHFSSIVWDYYHAPADRGQEVRDSSQAGETPTANDSRTSTYTWDGQMLQKPVCPYCRFPIKEGSRIHRCSRCQVLHHAECWRENRGCSTYGCRSRPAGGTEAVLPVVCLSCGERNREQDQVCWACSTALPRPDATPQPTPAAVAAPKPHAAEGSTPPSEQEIALRREAFDALLGIQSALELGISLVTYSQEVLKAKQAYDRLSVRTELHGPIPFWLLGNALLLHHQQAMTVWHLRT